MDSPISYQIKITCRKPESIYDTTKVEHIFQATHDQLEKGLVLYRDETFNGPAPVFKNGKYIFPNTWTTISRTQFFLYVLRAFHDFPVEEVIKTEHARPGSYFSKSPNEV